MRAGGSCFPVESWLVMIKCCSELFVPPRPDISYSVAVTRVTSVQTNYSTLLQLPGQLAGTAWSWPKPFTESHRKIAYFWYGNKVNIRPFSTIELLTLLAISLTKTTNIQSLTRLATTQSLLRWLRRIHHHNEPSQPAPSLAFEAERQRPRVGITSK